MAKELPYFKFYTGEWLNGDITIETFEAQGLFINLCACYWSKQGDFTKSKALKRFRGFEEVFKDLETEGFITVNKNDKITIKFLDEQMKERTVASKSASINGSKGGRPKKETTVEPILKPSKTIEAVKDNSARLEQFDKFFEVYNKNVGKDNCLKKFLNLSNKDVEKILETIEDYVLANDVKKFRKAPLVYLNQKVWKDEIILKENTINTMATFDKVVDLFNETEFPATIKKYTTSKEKIKVRLYEFLEKNCNTTEFKRKTNESALKWFISSLEFSKPKNVVDYEAIRLEDEKWGKNFNT